MSKTNYQEYFGTPKNVAKWLAIDKVYEGHCGLCPCYTDCFSCVDGRSGLFTDAQKIAYCMEHIQKWLESEVD